MLRTISRLAARRTFPRLQAAASAPTKVAGPSGASIGTIDADFGGKTTLSGITDGSTMTVPESPGAITAEVRAVLQPATKSDWIEAIGYPGQKHSHGGLTTVGRNNYLPGRYDYGRIQMPKGWFANFFYPVWELTHLFLVTDKWILLRQLRHVVFTLICFFPFWCQMQWNLQAWKEFKAKRE